MQRILIKKNQPRPEAPDPPELARKIAELCRLNYFYKRKTSQAGIAALAGVLAITTLVATVVASPMVLPLLGIPIFAAGAVKLTEREAPFFEERLWNRLHTKGIVADRRGEHRVYFSVDRKTLKLYKRLPANFREPTELNYYRATFSSDRVLSLKSLH